jgi:hypothetical protein
MGKLAERLADPTRSGVYRVETTEALEEAVALNAMELVRLAHPLATGQGWERIRVRHSRDAVVLLTGFAALAGSEPSRWRALLDGLNALAAERRSAGARFFVVFLDAEAALPLTPLYHWQGKWKESTHEVDPSRAARS